MGALLRLLQLLRVAEHHDVPRRAGGGEQHGERHLPGFVDEQHVERFGRLEKHSRPRLSTVAFLAELRHHGIGVVEAVAVVVDLDTTLGEEADETRVDASEIVLRRLSLGGGGLGEQRHDVSLLDLLPRWNGDFQMLWRPPQLDTRSLTFGMQGDPVRELRERLLQWSGTPADAAESDVFDDSLRELVIQFQRRNSLTADGVAGTRTQAMLDAALASTDSPLLSAVSH